MNRQRLILFILLILLALSIVWSYFNWPRQKTVTALKYAPGSRVPAEKRREPAIVKPDSRADGSALRLDLLDQEQPAFKGYRRNIFKPVFVDELKMMKQMASAKPALPPAPALKSVPAPVQPVAMPEPPHRELAKFTFLGFLKKDNQKTIFLAKDKGAKDKDIILVKKGDILAGGYEAASITDQALTILVIDTGEEIVIPLLENRPLTAAM